MEGNKQVQQGRKSTHRNIFDCFEVQGNQGESCENEEVSHQQHQNALAVLQKNYIFDHAGRKSVVLTRIRRHLTTRRLSTVKQSFGTSKNLAKKKTRPSCSLMEERHRELTDFRMLSVYEPLGSCVQCTIQIEPASLFSLSPIYRMFGAQKGNFMMAAKKIAGGFAEYVISSSFKLIEASNKWCLGRLRSNIFSTEWLLIKEQYQDNQPKELAFISYKTNLFGLRGPRQVSVVLPADDSRVCYPQQAKGAQSCGLKQSYEKEPSQLLFYMNRKPEYDPVLKKYRLRIEGCQTDEYDQKNLILENESEVPLTCGRRSLQEFYVEIRGNMSPLQAFAICLSNFDRKLFVQ